MPSTLEDGLISLLRQKYSPSAILLHGSRAIGKERVHSDWDIIMLFDRVPTNTTNREVLGRQCIEWKAFPADTPRQDIIKRFGVYLQFARVLWEANGCGSQLLRVSKLLYSAGPQLSSDQLRRERLYFRHKIDGLVDDQETPELFFRHLCALFNSSVSMWFALLKNKYSQPLYLAMPLIQRDDPEYYANLLTILGAKTNSQKIIAAERVYEQLFVLKNSESS
jgi:hypothetical protein